MKITAALPLFVSSLPLGGRDIRDLTNEIGVTIHAEIIGLEDMHRDDFVGKAAPATEIAQE